MLFYTQKYLSSQIHGNWDHLCLADTIVRVKGNPLFDFQDTEGYGIIVNKTGWILTCCHIVCDTELINVKTISGDELFMEIFDVDDTFDLAMLRPIDKQGSFKCINFGASLDLSNLPCNSFLLDDCFLTFEALICKKHEMLPYRSSIWTAIEIRHNNPANSANFGGPIIIPDVDNSCGNLLGIVTNLAIEKEILYNNNAPNNIIVGTAADAINIYLRFIKEKQKYETAELKQLKRCKSQVDLLLILQFKTKPKQYSVDYEDPDSTYNQLLNEVASDLAKLLKSKSSKIIDEVHELIRKLAPGSVIFEIRFFITLKSARQKLQAIKQLCKTLHTGFSEIINPVFLSEIDISSLSVFDHWKWFLEWNTALIVNESNIHYMIIDNFLFDLFRSLNFCSEEEYLALSKEVLLQERTNKFIDVIGNRYPSDIDFIVAGLQKQEQDRTADYFKVLKEKVMTMADPSKNVKQKITEKNSLNTQVSSLAVYFYCNLLKFTYSQRFYLFERTLLFYYYHQLK